MIITLTLNPAVDQTIFLDRLKLGGVDRFSEYQLDPAGKGVNVSRLVDRLGWPTIAFGFIAGEIGSIVQNALNAEGVQSHFIAVTGQTRLNVTVVDRSTGKSTGFYGPGPMVDAHSLETLLEILRFWLQACPVLVLAGSVPPGVPKDIYRTLAEYAHERCGKVILDADGEALLFGVQAKPYLIKPNRWEAEELLGRSLPSLEAVVQGAMDICRMGIDAVAVTMGADGAVLAHNDKAWHGVVPNIERKSTVGSGDSMVAGLALAVARGDSVEDGFRLGIAAGAATAMSSGTSLGRAEDVEKLLPRVVIRRLR